MNHLRCSKCQADPVNQNLMDWVILEIRASSATRDHHFGGELSVLLCGSCSRDLLSEAINKHWNELEKFSGRISAHNGQLEVHGQ